MCVCESDLIKMKLHLITRRYYPGIKYNEAALGQVADDLGIRFEREIRDLDTDRQADLAATVLNALPESAAGPSRTTGKKKRSGSAAPA
ncbi:MAG: hypothetical protein ACLFRB_07595 [Thiohalorhabdus sp.]|uniref:hypothetical protein n=1 Tax=Thiohalorhabdus sp. TaxID=3094134 RepID=UPI00397F85ED